MSTGTSPWRRRFRGLLAVFGGVVFVLGLLTALSPEDAAASLGALVTLLGADYILVALVGIVAFLIVLAVLVPRLRGGVDQTTPPAVEGVHPVPCFGDEFDEYVSDSGLRSVTHTERNDEVRTRLRELAITTLVRETNCTRAEARAQVDQGTWTDTDAAANFLAESGTPGLLARLSGALRGTSPFRRAARLTADEIAKHDQEAAR